MLVRLLADGSKVVHPSPFPLPVDSSRPGPGEIHTLEPTPANDTMTERNNQQTDSGGLSLSFHDLRVYGAPPPLPLLARCQRAALAAVTAAAAGSAIGRLPALPPTPPPKCLLNGVSGYIPANGLTGVMGGSGKSESGEDKGRNAAAETTAPISRVHAPPWHHCSL